MNEPRRLVVVGGGEHARVVMDAALSRPDLWCLVGFIDPHPGAATAHRLQVPCLGDDERGLELANSASHHWFTLGVGSLGRQNLRRKLAARYEAAGPRWATILHRSCWLSPTARIEPGVQVLAGAVVNTGATIGAHGIVNTGAVVEHDVEVGPFVHVGPGAVIGGGVSVEEGSYLGLGCRVRDHIRIGRNVVVGMGAVVLGAVADGTTVVGLPARPRSDL